jgi:hypothetical protein
MAFLPEQSVWSEGIYQLEVQDGPAGGADGIDNVPLKQLANRTRLLYDRQNANIAEMFFGYLVPFEFQPTALELATWRCLPLQGQVIQISLYQRLCDKMYVGNTANATADWWYKTSDAAGATRDPNGAYMRVLDHRGLFSRAAGQNSKYKMANDAPYDGKSIGAYISDAIRDIKGVTYSFYGPYTSGAFYRDPESQTGAINYDATGALVSYIEFLASRVVPTALENRPASISAYLCIKY